MTKINDTETMNKEVGLSQDSDPYYHQRLANIEETEKMYEFMVARRGFNQKAFEEIFGEKEKDHKCKKG